MNEKGKTDFSIKNKKSKNKTLFSNKEFVDFFYKEAVLKIKRNLLKLVNDTDDKKELKLLKETTNMLQKAFVSKIDKRILELKRKKTKRKQSLYTFKSDKRII